MEPQGKLTFFCPACREKLSFLDGTIIKLRGRLRAATFECETLFYFAAQLGNHGCIVGDGVQVHEGARIEFECPRGGCHHNFTAAYNDSLAEILLEDERGVTFRVAFSKVFGKDATFVLDVQHKELVHAYGADASHVLGDPDDRGRNFFGE
jgi:hypothetical protein